MIPLLREKLYLLKREQNRCDVTRALMLDVIEETFIDLNWLSVNDDEENQDIVTADNEKYVSDMKKKCIAFAKEVAEQISGELFNEDQTEIDICQWQYSKNSARIILKLLLIGNEKANGVQETLTKLVHHSIYEVRMIALEWILQILKIVNRRSIEISAFYKFKKDVFMVPDNCSRIRLYNELQQLLPGFVELTEPHQGCMGLILQILPYLLWNEQLSSAKEEEEGEKVVLASIELKSLWSKINETIQSTRHLSIRIACVPLLGAVTRLIAMGQAGSDASFIAQAMEGWAQQIHECVKDEAPDPLRFETLKSYIYLGDILSPNSPFYKQLPSESYTAIMRSLFDLVLLLQDDDSDIRIHASTIASQIVLGLKSDVFEAKTLELVFEHLHSHYQNNPEYPEGIHDMIVGHQSMQDLFDYELNSTKHIFELERSNIYKEDLINIHVAALYAHPTPAQVAPSLDNVRMIAGALTTLHQGTTKSSQIINEFTARPDVFTAIYRSILWMSLCVRNAPGIEEPIKSGKYIFHNYYYNIFKVYK